MGLDQDLAMILRQEEVLIFTRFGEDDAFALGTMIREEAASRGFALAIDIRLTQHPLFFFAMPGTGPDNVDWIRRKINVTMRYLKSSYAVGRHWAKRGQNASPERGLNPLDYAAHGGCFPIRLAGTGVVGTICVSGVPERDDHMTVVRALAKFLKQDASVLELGVES
jgi:uncharacterized protein (UPF0303 family)